MRIIVKYYLNTLSKMKSCHSEIKIQCMLNTVSMPHTELIRTVEKLQKILSSQKIVRSKSGLFEYVCGFIHCMLPCLY